MTEREFGLLRLVNAYKALTKAYRLGTTVPEWVWKDLEKYNKHFLTSSKEKEK